MIKTSVARESAVATMSDMAKHSKTNGGAPKQGASRPDTPDKGRKGVSLGLFLPAELDSRLKKYLTDTKPKPSKTATVCTALEVFLDSKGF